MEPLLERTFEVAVDRATAWALLSEVEHWPEWAPHIKRATIDGGMLGPKSTGTFSFRPAGSGSFEMTSWEPPVRWTWSGKALGLPINYHHAFEELADGRSRLVWTVELAGASLGLRSSLFTRIYSRNIDRAWPRFVEWAENKTTTRPDAG